MKKEKTTYYNEVQAHQSRHLLLRGIRFFNRGAMLLIVLWVLVLSGQQVRQWALHSPFFESKQVVVQGNTLLPEERILSLASIELRCNLFRIQAEEVRDRLLAHDYIRTTRIRRRWPSTLRIEIEERKPVAVLTEVRKCVDDRGVLLPLLSSNQELCLPALIGIGDIPSVNGATLCSGKVELAIAILKGTAEICSAGDLNFTSLDVSDAKNPLLYLYGMSAPIRLGGLDCLSMLPSLSLVLSDLERKGIAAEYIDLRFHEQIAVKPKSSRRAGDSTVSRSDLNGDTDGTRTGAVFAEYHGNDHRRIMNMIIENGAGINGSERLTPNNALANKTRKEKKDIRFQPQKNSERERPTCYK